jgi:hypothetical protein
MRTLRLVGFTLAALLVLSACSDNLLDIENPNQQTSESFWSNADQAVQGVNAAYEPLTYDGMYNRMVHAAQDIRSDEAIADSLSPRATCCGRRVNAGRRRRLSRRGRQCCQCAVGRQSRPHIRGSRRPGI